MVFINRIRKLTQIILSDVQELIPLMAPEHRDTFIEMALRRIVECYLDNAQTSHSRIITEAIVDARGFAWCFHKEMFLIAQSISSLSGKNSPSCQHLQPGLNVESF